jgi:hypothetical protein
LMQVDRCRAQRASARPSPPTAAANVGGDVILEACQPMWRRYGPVQG